MLIPSHSSVYLFYQEVVNSGVGLCHSTVSIYSLNSLSISDSDGLGGREVQLDHIRLGEAVLKEVEESV